MSSKKRIQEEKEEKRKEKGRGSFTKCLKGDSPSEYLETRPPPSPNQNAFSFLLHTFVLQFRPLKIEPDTNLTRYIK
jgi:hypothetical protein